MLGSRIYRNAWVVDYSVLVFELLALVLCSTDGISIAKTYTTSSWRPTPISFKTTRLQVNLQTYQSYGKMIWKSCVCTRLKGAKSPGIDSVPAELLKQGGEGRRHYKNFVTFKNFTLKSVRSGTINSGIISGTVVKYPFFLSKKPFGGTSIDKWGKVRNVTKNMGMKQGHHTNPTDSKFLIFSTMKCHRIQHEKHFKLDRCKKKIPLHSPLKIVTGF